MRHADFVEGYHAGRLVAQVDRTLALRLANSTAMERRYQATHIFWTWIWFLSFPAAIACLIWVNWWVALLVLIIGLRLPAAIKKSATAFVLEQALEDEEFYTLVTSTKALVITPRAA